MLAPWKEWTAETKGDSTESPSLRLIRVLEGLDSRRTDCHRLPKKACPTIVMRPHINMIMGFLKAILLGLVRFLQDARGLEHWSGKPSTPESGLWSHCAVVYFRLEGTA